jgi:3-deoxy-D-manno-octulosonic-acid transferase
MSEKCSAAAGIVKSSASDSEFTIGKCAIAWPGSVGEVTIALKLASAIKLIEPDARFVLSTTTTTGFSLATANAPPWIEVIYTPLDFWPIMRRAFSVIRPVKVVLTEAEIWLNLAAEAHSRKIPLALVNARLSPRSERRFQQFQAFVAPTFRLLDLVCVQEPEDADRWARLGVQRSRIHHTGSIKYDPGEAEERRSVPAVGLFHLNSGSNDLVLFGGSTHRGEEETLAQVFLELRPHFPSLSLFIAPRHVERVREIRKQLEALSLNVKLRTEAESHRDSHPDCVLLDKTGELQRWYEIATVVFVGKSLTAHGGQNPVEPILAGKPVIFGPHMENFSALANRLIAQRGAIQINDAEGLESACDRLLRNSEERHRVVQNAEAVLNAHRGATSRTARLVVDLKVALAGSRSGALQSAD